MTQRLMLENYSIKVQYALINEFNAMNSFNYSTKFKKFSLKFQNSN